MGEDKFIPFTRMQAGLVGKTSEQFYPG